jgi:hypothetical protein
MPPLICALLRISEHYFPFVAALPGSYWRVGSIQSAIRVLKAASPSGETLPLFVGLYEG